MFHKAAVLTVMLATTITVAACGGSGSPSSGSAGADNSSSSHARSSLKMARCIRSHGVPDFPDSPTGPSGIQSSANSSGGGSVSVNGVNLNVSPQTLQKAMIECRRYAPQGPPISGAQLAKIKQGALKMAECMRSRGVPNFPDPRVTTGPGGHGISVRIGGPPSSGANPGGFNPNSPAFLDAQKVCTPLMGAPGPRSQKLGK